MEPRSQVNGKAEPWEIHDGPGSVLELSVSHVSCPIILTAALSVRALWLILQKRNGRLRVHSQGASNSSSKSCSSATLCCHLRCGFRSRGKFWFCVTPSIPRDRWPVGSGQAETPSSHTSKKPEKEIAEFEKHALKWDFLRPEEVFTEKFYRD